MDGTIVRSVEDLDATDPGERVNMLGVGISPLNMHDVAARIEGWRAAGRREYVCCVSVHGLVTAQRHPDIKAALNGAGVATKDGMPLVWWTRRAGHPKSRRVCGPDLMALLCGSGDQRHFFYGGTEPVVAALIGRLRARHPGIVIAGAISPPFRKLSAVEDAADVAAINAARPDFVWVGLGMPKQERWMVEHVGRIDAPALFGVGAAFDFHAGTLARAPSVLQRSGLEWLFRLAKEPRRLGRRYLIDNSAFLFHAFRQVTGLARYPLAARQTGKA